MSDNKNTKPALITDRLKAVEELTAGLAGFVQNEVPALKTSLANLVEVLNAVITLGGDDFAEKVQAKVEEIQMNRAKAQVESQKAQLAKYVADGVLTVTGQIGEDSILVLREISLEGKEIGTGWVQLNVAQFVPDIRQKMIGQSVGYVIDMPNGKIEVIEAYNPAPKKDPEVVESTAQTAEAAG